MYRTLFELAGLAIVAWLPLIFFPTWKWTRRLAESAIFPAYLCAIYAVGVVAVFRDMGVGVMADFGTAEGVIGLLRTEPVAIVAWLHILAFDQVVGLLIYRDNLRHRVVSVPVQSVLLFATLMLGPLGFLTYWTLRVSRRRGWPVAWGEPQPVERQATRPRPAAVRFADVVPERTLPGVVLGLWRRERVLVALGALGLTLAAATGVVAAVHGDWLLEPEGRLLEAAKFDTALGIYILTLALLLPLAGFSARGRRRWIGWMVGLALYSFAIENVQAWRGLNPRFSSVAGPLDQLLGLVFFFTALGVMTLFIILAARFFRGDALPDHAPLRVALRYAAGGAMLAFGVGIVMSGASGRFVNGAGNLMPIHAAGFHGLQALPLVALLLGWAAAVVPPRRALTWIHAAGAGWLALCAGLALQAFAGRPPAEWSPAMALTAAGALTWLVAAAYAWRVRAGAPPTAEQVETAAARAVAGG